MEDLAPQLLKILQIIWINVILSGDNAVVIALACRGLPANRQRMGMVLGAGVAVGLRIVFTVGVVYLLATPFLKIAGGLLLFWIAVKLLLEDEEEQEGKIAETDRLWHAVRTIAIADAVMSLDNVLAIAAVAKDSMFLLILGLTISIPLIVAGAALIMALLSRFPVFVWLGAGLLGWVAGQMLITDPWLAGQMLITDPWLDERLGTSFAHRLELPAAALGAAIVIGLGYVLRRRAQSAAAERV